MFLSVELDGARFVIDPGFGPFGWKTSGATGRRQRAGRSLNTPDGSRKRSLGDARHPRWGGNSRVGFHPRDPVSGRFRNGQPFHGNPSNLWVRQWDSRERRNGRRPGQRDHATSRCSAEGRSGSILPDRSALRVLLAKHFGFDLPGSRDYASAERTRLAMNRRPLAENSPATIKLTHHQPRHADFGSQFHTPSNRCLRFGPRVAATPARLAPVPPSLKR